MVLDQAVRRFHSRDKLTMRQMACVALACLTLLVQPAACDEMIDAAKLLTDRYVHARASAMSTPVDMDSMCDEPGVYGKIRRNAKLYEMPWILLRSAQNRELSPHIPLYCHPSMYIASKVKLIFLRQQKSSSSSVIWALADMLCKNPQNCTSEELVQRAPTDVEWKESFVFTWIRNPVQRMISSYTMMCEQFLRKKIPGQAEPGPPCCIPFEDFSQNPYNMISACATQQCCLWHGTHWDDNFIAGHLNDQSHSVFTPDGRSLVDFIGRTEHMEQDWLTFVRLLNRHAHTDMPPARLQHVNIMLPPDEKVAATGTFVPCLGKKVRHITKSSLNNLSLLFALDRQVFKFGPPKAPKAPWEHIRSKTESRRTKTESLG